MNLLVKFTKKIKIIIIYLFPEITFKSKHFNGDGSSTSSGEDLSKGLRFRGKKIDRQDSSDSSESFELVSKDDL